jgi:oxidase EvaA
MLVMSRQNTSYESDTSGISPVHNLIWILNWLQEKNIAVNVTIEQIPFAKMTNWYVEPETGNIRHQSKKFFSIEGVEVAVEAEFNQRWTQPIINQPEVGYLGFMVKKINGLMHFLVQAKVEPGNVNCVQLSPTLQATKSNFTQVHKGALPKYLDYFRLKKGKVLVDQLQSEQGARFYKKRNRNIIIEIEEDIAESDNFIWVTLGQIKELLKIDNLINMDTRTVISSIHFSQLSMANLMCTGDLIDQGSVSEYGSAILKSYQQMDCTLHSNSEIHSWLTELKSKYELHTKLISLKDVKDWVFEGDRIYHCKNRYFSIIAVDVLISNREVSKWCQPLVMPSQNGIVGFITKNINGVLHFLMQAKVEVGNRDVVELAPTVQCITGGYSDHEREYQVQYLDLLLSASPNEIRYDVMLSEEGGRFYKNQNRHLIIQVSDNYPIEETERYCWMTLSQIMRYMEFNNLINIEARSLISLLAV